MSMFLYLTGVLLIIAAIVVSILAGGYGLFVFPVTFALGCIILGVGKIIDILEEIRDRQS